MRVEKKIKVLGVIPARGGSKGVPHKNIAPVGSKPLIAWTLHAAQNSKRLDRTIISTDSQEIADIAQRYDGIVPFLRPKELSEDETSSEAVAIHAIQWLEKNEQYKPDYLLYLQPTSPFRTSEDIDASIEMAIEKNADAVLGVTSVEHHPYFMKRIDSEGRLEPIVEQKVPVPRRQDLSSLYRLNGAIFLIRTKTLIETKSWYGKTNYGYSMPSERSLDIDTPWDIQLADLLLKEKIK